MYRVGVIGHFGVGVNLANGQTIKTKIITKETDNYCGEKSFIVDAHGGLKAVFPVAIGSIQAVAKCKNVFLMLTENGLIVSVPVLAFFNKVFKRRLHYIVIGGWLPDFLKNHSYLAKCLKSFHKIYVETYKMKQLLNNQGFDNVCVMPNCKRLDILSTPCLPSENPYKLCTFSRVMKEKGIEDAVNAVMMANKQLKTNAYSLDIYGQIDMQQKKWFEDLKSTFPSYIRYSGLIPYNKSCEVLKNYFALLFPTYYEGEGFAGTAIDAFSAGVPVIASDWKYNDEVIKNGINGRLFQHQNVNELAAILVTIYKNPEEWNLLRYKCIEEANEFRPENVMRVLFAELV